MLVGLILCLIGLVVFIYGMINMSPANALANSFFVMVGIFLGIAGLLVLMTNAFSGGFVF